MSVAILKAGCCCGAGDCDACRDVCYPLFPQLTLTLVGDTVINWPGAPGGGVVLTVPPCSVVRMAQPAGELCQWILGGGAGCTACVPVPGPGGNAAWGRSNPVQVRCLTDLLWQVNVVTSHAFQSFGDPCVVVPPFFTQQWNLSYQKPNTGVCSMLGEYLFASMGCVDLNPPCETTLLEIPDAVIVTA